MAGQRTPTPGRVVGAPSCARFAVVVDPGTLMERVDVYASTAKSAYEWAADLRDDGLQVDVMRITPSGELTTEF
ncbi:MAG TPA: hypothetical protein VEC57_14715 [Candidatus Limnocylindrales bacterium]|nr:hypothetical protein [Candidatus Limnocylindrales bacterium]